MSELHPTIPNRTAKSKRWHKSLKAECIRPGTPLSLEDARRLVEGYVEHYNNVRLNSSIGYITPKDMLAGRQQAIQAERDRKLAAARKTAPGSSSKGRVKTDETTFGVAGEGDFRIADYSEATLHLDRLNSTSRSTQSD
jgi:hypothetical protein